MYALKVKVMVNKIKLKVLQAKGKKVVVVEDLISTGGSSINAVQALEEAGAEVLGVVAIFTYGLAKADEMFEEQNCRFTR